MKCAICGNIIDKEHLFTDLKSHKENCPIYIDTKGVVNIILPHDYSRCLETDKDCFACYEKIRQTFNDISLDITHKPYCLYGEKR